METTGLTAYVIVFILAYLMGSIPSGVLVTAIFFKQDIRKKGSGNIGATNVARVAGMRLGLFTLALDLTKGALPVFLAGKLGSSEAVISMTVASLAAVGGHMYPVYTRFRTGGKGVATAAGCFLVVSPPALLTAVAVFSGVVGFSRRVSAGSIAAAATLPPAAWFFSGSIPVFTGALIIGLWVVIRHKDNILRLVKGEEPAFFGNRKR